MVEVTRDWGIYPLFRTAMKRKRRDQKSSISKEGTFMTVGIWPLQNKSPHTRKTLYVRESKKRGGGRNYYWRSLRRDIGNIGFGSHWDSGD